MLQEAGPNFKIVLLGVPYDIAEMLDRIASRWGLVLYVPQQIPDHEALNLVRDASPNLAFVWTGGTKGTSLLETVKMLNVSVTVVAVNRSFRTSEVLDALDSGAADYCAPPFDNTHIQRLLDGCLQEHLLLLISLGVMSSVVGERRF